MHHLALPVHAVLPLQQGWALAGVPAGTPLEQVPEQAWQAIEAPEPVAAALARLGQWSLDDPADKPLDAQDWWYRLFFDAPGVTVADAPVLCLDGLATLTEVWLNGEALLQSANMFLAHELPLAQGLKAKGNELLLRFAALDAALTQRRPRPRWRTPMVAHQQLRWQRCTLLGRTPGWSPPAPVVGPWRGVRLELRRQAVLNRRHFQVSLQPDGVGEITAAFSMDGLGANKLAGAWLVLDHAGEAFEVPIPGLLAGHGEATLRVPAAQAWWPHTHGTPHLHALGLRLAWAGGDTQCVALGAIGFRRIELDQRDGGFALRVNGQSVFCRGAVWSPLDVLRLNAPVQAVHRAVQQAARAGLNMLRVPGTQVYEDAAFFEACNREGVLVWQDFMFANLDYPLDDTAFAATVQQEAQQQLQRWQGQPCLAVLCGNSEVEQQAAMWGAPRAQWTHPWFETNLPALCRQAGLYVPYWPSSAHGGAFPHQANAGTASYYGVGAYLRDTSDARASELRFATECLAFANVPEDATLARMPGGLALRVHHPAWKARAPRDLGAGWDFEDVRDHYLRQLFSVDPAALRYADHNRYLLLSRLASGLAMAQAFSHWRRPGASCGGALVLSLRDLWAGAGWGLVADDGAPKAAYHALQQVLQPVHLGLSDEGVNGLALHLINEGAQDVAGTLEWVVWRHGEVAVTRVERPWVMPARSAQIESLASHLDYFTDLTHAYRFGPLQHDAVSATLRQSDGQVRAQAVYFPGGALLPQVGEVGLAVQVQATQTHSVELVVSSRALAQWVHFEAPGLQAEEAYFHLLPGQTRRVRLRRLDTRPPGGEVRAVNALRGARF
jgi:beta-mannosidase